LRLTSDIRDATRMGRPLARARHASHRLPIAADRSTLKLLKLACIPLR
jgi:hypothetical protein